MILRNLLNLLPNGIDVNSEDHVESKNAINEFFLNAFLDWYNDLEHYAVSFAGPQSYNAIQFCDHDELSRFVNEQGLDYYYSNDLSVNQYLCYVLYKYGLNSALGIDAITKYAFNSLDTTGTPIYEGLDPHHYQILCEGDVATGVETPEVIDRIVDNINNQVSVTEQLDGLAIRENDSIPTYYGVYNGSTHYRVCRMTIEPRQFTTAFYLENVGTEQASFSLSIAEVDATKYYTSVDGGATWNSYQTNTTIYVDPGKKIHIKGTKTTQNASEYNQFTMNGQFAAGGNLSSLLVSENWDMADTLDTRPYAFYKLFYLCSSLTKAPDLPYTRLSEGCYYNMFYGCSGLTRAPYLPAEEGKPSCYRQMFRNCTHITEIKVNLRRGYGSNATNMWVYGVNAQGRFYRPETATFWSNLTTGNGVPTNFTVWDLT